MANALKGEASFAHDGRDLTLVYDAQALLAIEDALDMGLFALLDHLSAAERDARTVKVGTLATILQCGLAAHHPEIDRADAAEMLLSGDEGVQQAIGVAITLMMPKVGDAGSTHPQKPAAVNPVKPSAKRNGTGRKR